MADEQIVEQVADQIEDVALQIEEVADAARSLNGREIGFFFTGAGIGVVAGFAAGFRIMEKRVDAKYSKICDDAVAEMREHYHQKIVAAQPKPDIEEVERIVNENGYTDAEQKAIDETNQRISAEPNAEEVVVEAEVAEEVEVVDSVVNVFTETTPNDNWDYAVETRRRSNEFPYVIHADEFKQNESDYDQVEYTFYDEDEVVADVRDNRVSNVEEVIGRVNLTLFGHGSGNKHVVYVRNDKLGMDMEINKSEGSYAEIIQGHEIQHSDYSNRRRRMRRGFDDD